MILSITALIVSIGTLTMNIVMLHDVLRMNHNIQQRLRWLEMEQYKTCPHGRPFNGAHCEGCNT